MSNITRVVLSCNTGGQKTSNDGQESSVGSDPIIKVRGQENC